MVSIVAAAKRRCRAGVHYRQVKSGCRGICGLRSFGAAFGCKGSGGYCRGSDCKPETSARSGGGSWNEGRFWGMDPRDRAYGPGDGSRPARGCPGPVSRGACSSRNRRPGARRGLEISTNAASCRPRQPFSTSSASFYCFPLSQVQDSPVERIPGQKSRAYLPTQEPDYGDRCSALP